MNDGSKQLTSGALPESGVEAAELLSALKQCVEALRGQHGRVQGQASKRARKLIEKIEAGFDDSNEWYSGPQLEEMALATSAPVPAPAPATLSEQNAAYYADWEKGFGCRLRPIYGPPNPAPAPACEWGGGNDYSRCLTCGLEYDYRREEKPDCPHAAHAPAPAAVKDKIVGILRSDFDQTPKNWEGAGWYDNAEEVADSIIALFPAPAPVDAGGLVVRLVKPLEWQDAHEAAAWSETPIGDYRAYRDGTWIGRAGSGSAKEHSLDAARAAAQADYTARILSALDASAFTAAAKEPGQ